MYPDSDGPLHPGEYSILAFSLDNRFKTVQFDGYRGDQLVVSLTLPFIGWATIVTYIKDDEYGTQLVPVGIVDTGEPVMARTIEQNYLLDEGKVIQVKLTPADGSGIVDAPDWPDVSPSL